MPRPPRAISFIVFAVLALLVAASSAFAAPGDLDSSFGNGGLAASTLGADHAFSYGVAVAPSGRIYASGIALSSPYTLIVGAFTASGVLDTSFNPSYGYTTSAIGTGNADSGYVALQPDGKLLLGGQGTSSGTAGTTVLRFAADGPPDSGYASGGTLSFYPAPGSLLVSMLVQPDGKLVLVNRVATGLRFSRYDTGGSPDPTFGGGSGYVVAPQPSGSITWKNAAIGSDGSLWGVGVDSTSTQFITTRVTPAGTVDYGFGGGLGYVLENLKSGDDGLTQVVGQSDAKTVAAGVDSDSTIGHDAFTLVRHDADGSLDPSFGSGGVQIDPFSQVGDSWPRGLAVMPDGRIVALIEYDSGGGQDEFAVARFLPSGAFDPSFGANGVKVLSLPNIHVVLTGLTLQPDGKILVLGDGPVPPAFAQNGMYLLRLDNSVPATPLPTYTPTDRITSPSKSRIKARKLKKFAGVAGPDGHVAKVEIALRELNPKLLKRKRECLWLKNSKGGFAKKRDRTKKCSPAKAKWLRASGVTNWSYKLKRTLKKGSYRLYVRVTLADGITTNAFTAHAGTLKAFKLN